MTLWLVAVIPTRLPAAAARRSSGRRCTSCRTRAGPGSASVVRSRRRASRIAAASRSVSPAFDERLARRLPDARRAAEQQVPCQPVSGRRHRCRGRRPTRRARTATPGDRRSGPSRAARSRAGAARRSSRRMSTSGPRIDRDHLARAPLERAGARAEPGSCARVVERRRGRGRTPGPGTRTARSACPASPRRSDRPARARRAGSSSSIELLRRRVPCGGWNSHHIDLSSRRCQPRSWASSQRPAAPGLARRRRSGRSPGRPGARPGPGPGPAPRSASAGSGWRSPGRGTARPVSRGQLVAQPLQPVAQLQVADHVVAVVALDAIEDGRSRVARPRRAPATARTRRCSSPRRAGRSRG